MNWKISLIRKSQCYRLTWFSRGLVLLLLFGFAYYLIKGWPQYLSKSDPIHGEILVLDGLLPDYAIKDAIAIFNAGTYDKIVVSGGDLATGYYLSEYNSMADISYATFVKLGFNITKLIALPTGNVQRDRTYTSGLALKSWLANQNKTYTQVDVLSMGFHSRRSQYLFQKALGNDCSVGVISVDNRFYDKHLWWRSSEGIRTIISETIGYLYVVFFFFPA